MYSQSTGNFYLKNSNTAGVADITFRFGPSGKDWLPITGDWNNDNIDTIGLYDSINGDVYLRNYNYAGAADISFKYGKEISGTIMTGDWDNDGVDSIGLYDNNEGKFYLTNENKDKQMNAYPYGPIKGPDGFFHIVWVWRDSSGAEFNHDLSYTRSRDLVNWETSNGRKLQLPITINGAEIIDSVPVNGGIINGNTKIGFDSQGRVIISYHKYDSNGNTQIYNARLENGEWRIYQTSNWNHRWDFGGGGSIDYNVRVYPVKLEQDGGLSQEYSHWIEGSGKWKLDENTLQIIGTSPREKIVPSHLATVETYCPECDANGEPLYVKIFLSKIDSDSGYFLRWETLGRNRDYPRDFIPPPSMLRLYKYVKK